MSGANQEAVRGGLPSCLLPTPCVQNHAANLCVLPGGDLACVWFGGTQEGIPDISVYFARLPGGARGTPGGAWTAPVKLSDDPTRSEQNPLLFVAPDSTLWLLWTAQISGNQDTAIVRRRLSRDNGASWGAIETLFEATPTSGTFIRQPITVLPSGEWLLPVFYCNTIPGRAWAGDADTSAVKISSDGGRTWRDVAVPGSTGCVHMNIGRLADGSLLALFRSRWADNIYLSRSTDSGNTWTVPAKTALPNNNASIQFTVLANGHLALAFNNASAAQATERRASLYDDIGGGPAPPPPPQGGERRAFWGAPRAPMTLAISEDGGRTWPHLRDVETGDGYCMTNNSSEKRNRELSYPSIVQGTDGKLHLAFTHFRQAIKHVRVDEDWVKAGG